MPIPYSLVFADLDLVHGVGLCTCVTWAQVTLAQLGKLLVWRKKQPLHTKVSVRPDYTQVGNVLTSGTDWGRGQWREEPQAEKLAGKH